MKQLKVEVEWNSIFRQPKWLCRIEIYNFSSFKANKNFKFMVELQKLINKYNKSKNDKKVI